MEGMKEEQLPRDISEEKPPRAAETVSLGTAVHSKGSQKVMRLSLTAHAEFEMLVGLVQGASQQRREADACGAAGWESWSGGRR